MGMMQWIQDQDKDLSDLRESTDLSEWRREVREELDCKANLEDVKQTLDHVAESMEEKTGRSELAHLLTTYVKSDDLLGELDLRPTRAEVNRWLDHKAEDSDLRLEVQKLNERIDRLNSELSVIQASSATVGEVASLREKLDKKVDSEIFREAARNFVTVDNFQEVVNKKADFEEIEEILERKADGQDLSQLIGIIEKKADNDVVEELFEMVKSKADSKDLEMVTVSINRKADRKQCDENTDQLAFIRKEVESVFEEMDQTFSEVKALLEKSRQDIEACHKEIKHRPTKAELTEVRQMVSKRVESSIFLEELAKVKDDQIREAKLMKADAEKVVK